MRIAQVNSCDQGSTGKIMIGIAEVGNKCGNEIYTFSLKPRRYKGNKKAHYFSSFFEYAVHYFLSMYTGMNGCFSHFGTYSLLKRLDEINPDILHLHNLHNCYINLPMLFRWIKKRKVKVMWTLHDCWAFTGQCPHFQIAACDKWKTGCYDCPQYKSYPASMVDRTKTMYRLKKKWFTGITDMTIVTPSEWLANLAKQSFLNNYPIKVINNGIDLNVFRPTKSNLREKYNLQDKVVLLGVAWPWSERKGLDVFVELSKRLDSKYQIILVGLTGEQIKALPKNMIGVEHTSSAAELAQYYTMADVFVNPTREDNFPTVNIEALACGTPVVTFKTGGSPECIDSSCGVVVPCGDIVNLTETICDIKPDTFAIEQCLKRAAEFDKNEKFNEYIKIYADDML